MILLDEDALICDLAETYHIYDYRSLPVKLVATLAAGLRDNSRIKLLAADSPVSQDTVLLACIADRIEAFRYSFAKDPKEPPSLVNMLLGKDNKEKPGAMSFNSIEEFNEALARARGNK